MVHFQLTSRCNLRCPWRFNPKHRLDKKTVVDHPAANEEILEYGFSDN